MARRGVVRGGQDRAYKSGDPLRAIYHDTIPAELPVLLSNSGAHANLHRLRLRSHAEVQAAVKTTSHSNADEWIASAVACLLPNASTHTSERPYEIDTNTSEGKQRTISLPHIRSQWRYAVFLHENSEKIIYYCGRSTSSLRAPSGVGRNTVVTQRREDVDNARSLSQSFELNDEQAGATELTPRVWVERFFLYRGVRRLYKFFESEDFTRLEERFPILLTLDVQSAFSSIYTHSISWAVRGKHHSKTHVGRPPLRDGGGRDIPFGDEFDRIMQLSNWNETNGILIGPEISRIFAEIIFQRIDIDLAALVNRELRRVGIVNPSTAFHILRYVDDFFVFARSTTIATVVRQCLSSVLAHYKLRLNSAKAQQLDRPFLNAQGLLSHDLSELIDEHMAQLRNVSVCIRERVCNGEVSNSRVEFVKWRRVFLKALRAAAKMHGSGTSLAVSRVPAALREQAFRLLKDITTITPEEACLRADEAWALVDACGYVLSLRMTEAAAVSFCATVLACLRLNEIAGGVSVRTAAIERLFERCRSLLYLMSESDSEIAAERNRERRGNLVACNLIACMSEFDRPFQMSECELSSLLGFDPRKYTEQHYFELITILFYTSRSTQPYSDATAAVERLEVLVKNNGIQHAGIANAVLDILACPSIDRQSRRGLLRSFASSVGVSKQFVKTNTRADDVLSRFEEHSWFVGWKCQISLLQQVRRKTARQMY